MNEESRPLRPAPETPAKKSAHQFTPEDDLHAAFLAGLDAAYARGQRDASESLAREWLHNLALEFTGLAVRNANAKGENWAQAMRDQAYGGDAQ